jgi:hypothetical protein
VCTFEFSFIWKHNLKFSQFQIEIITKDTAGVPTKQVHVFAMGGGMV